MPAKASSLLRDLRTLPGAFRVLFAGTFINRFGMFVFPFLTIFLNHRGISLGWIGLVLAGFGAGLLAATLAGGWCADRFGRRNTIVLGTFAQAASMMALYFTMEPAVLALLTTFCGFAGGFYNPAASALVADLVPPASRLTAYAALRLAGNSGFAFGTAVGGFLVQYNPFWLFAGDALTTVSFGLLALLALPHGVRQKHSEARWSEALAKLRSDGEFWALAGAQMGTAFVFAQFASSYALEVAHRGITFAMGGWKFSPEQVYGLLIGWNGLLITAMELPLTRVTVLLRPRRVMACGYVMIGIGFASNMFDAGAGVLAAGMTLFTLGEMLTMPMVGAWISHLAPENMRGRYMGALAASWAVGGILGQNIGLGLYAVNTQVLWLLCALLGFASALMITMLGKSESPASTPARSPAAPVAVE